MLKKIITISNSPVSLMCSAVSRKLPSKSRYLYSKMGLICTIYSRDKANEI